MAGLAVIFKKMGKTVSGADTDEEQITDELLNKHGIEHEIGFDHLSEGADLAIYSAAHAGADNPLVKKAKELGIDTINQAPLLGSLMSLFKTSVAVTGTHGKTTTSALLSYALINLGVFPSYLVGAPSFSGKDGADYSKTDFFAVEADEYAVDPPDDKTVKFSFLNPRFVLITNIDFDHPDVFDSLDEVKKQFSNFLKDKDVIVCADDVNLMSVATRTHTKTLKTFGFDAGADTRIGAVTAVQDNTTFELFEKNHSLGVFSIKLFGKKNISNAAGVVATLLSLGFKADDIKNAIKDFSGVKRRFEQKALIGDIYLFDDYAHHPVEIEAAIEATRSRFPDYKIVVLFQSHTYSRTKALLKDFAKSLTKADYAIVAPIFSSARENKEDFKVGPEDIEAEAKKEKSGHVVAATSMEDVLVKLKPVLASKQVIFTMGAGSIYQLENDIIKMLKNTTATS